MTLSAIPVLEHPSIWAPAAFLPESFEEIREDEHLTVEMKYPKLHMKEAVARCLLRTQAAERLRLASEYLQEFLPGAKLKIWDAWRPFALQQELYYVYREDILSQFHLEELPFEEQEKMVQKYVSLPVDDRDLPPVHTTGGAVDVTISAADGTDILMGCAFDAFSDETETAFFERIPKDLSDDESARLKQICQNRRILYTVMTRAGFVNLPSEWWHYDYGDRFWGWANQVPSMYRGVFSEDEMR